MFNFSLYFAITGGCGIIIYYSIYYEVKIKITVLQNLIFLFLKRNFVK